tara:strand:+ start:21217 stop:21543 length:327 start_codon:yes stop_codon:yes gene_type:complete
MRIGASFNLPQLPQRPSSQTVVTPSAAQDKDSARSSSTSSAISSTVKTDFDTDFIQARASQSADSGRFYSANRELPLRGQEAMQTYLTNAGFQFSGAKAELVGVDIYA